MPIDINDITFLGTGLRRPECVLTTASGDIVVSNWDGGVTIIDHHGDQRALLADAAPWLRPNGIAMRSDGSFLLAHLGDDVGGVYALDRDGRLHDYLVELDGERLPPTNFVVQDGWGRTWITVSTRHRPRAAAYRSDVSDGFVILVDEHGARVVADELGYTNEAQLHPSGSHLYVNETFARRLSRFAVRKNGTLGPRETIAEFGHGTFPDGLVFDEDGGAWVTSIISNRIVRIGPHGEHTLVLEDADHDHLDVVEAAFQSGSLGRRHLDTVVSSRLMNVSSLAFGGPDLRTIYLGCLLGDSIATFRSPIAGARPHHW